MNFYQFLDVLKERENMEQHGVYTSQEIHKWFMDSNKPISKFKLHKFMRQLSEMGSSNTVHRLHRGIYWIKNDNIPLYKVFPHLIKALRPASLNYVSMESVLSSEGVISQIPFVITMTTTGRSGRYDTEVGSVEFVRTRKKIDNVYQHLTEFENGLLYADVGLAYKELKRLKRNLHLIDMDALQESLNDWH